LDHLVDLLERLEALLKNVRDVMERQSSLQEMHFPAPSMTVFKCLQSCGETLKPLPEIAKRSQSSQQPDRPAVARLVGAVKLGFKAKNIADFEMRIDRDINYLHATLGTNINAIL
jgi:hypothetical protein